MNPLFKELGYQNSARCTANGWPNPYGFTDEELNGTPVNAAEIETSRRIAEGVPAEAAGKLPWLDLNSGRIHTIPLEFTNLELECGYHITSDNFADLVYVAILGQNIYPYLTREQRMEIQAECQHELDVNEIEVAV